MDISITKLSEILSELEKITEFDTSKFDRLAERAKGIANNKFSPDAQYWEKIDNIKKRVNDAFSGLRNHHIHELMGIVQIMIDEIEITQPKEHKTDSAKSAPVDNSTHSAKYSIKNDNLKIFIVHGHNDTMKEATARTIEKLGLKAVILHEKANAGDTIIEKFTKHSDVGFAVVLLSADDYGYAKTDTHANAKLRARQNVIFELGFFYSKLSRKRVVAIFEQSKNFEKPSDIDGVVYIAYGSDGKWKFDLARELMEVGYQIDANVLMK